MISSKKYIIAYIVCLGITIAMLFLVNTKIPLVSYDKLIIGSIVGFTLLDLYTLFQEKRLKNDTNSDNKLFALAMKKMIYKLGLSIAIIGGYYVKIKPEGGHFVIPFIIIYFGFMIFETYLIAQQK